MTALRRGMRTIVVGLAGCLLPGSGHLLVGRRALGLAILVPTLALAALAVVWVVAVGPFGVAAALVSPGALTALAVANFAVALWRAGAGLDAARRTRPRPAALVATVLLVGLVVAVPHAFAAESIAAADDLLGSLFAPAATLAPSAAPAAPTPASTLTDAASADATAAGPTPAVTPTTASVAPAPTATPAPVVGTSGDGLGAGTLPALGAAVPWAPPGAVPWGDDGRFDLLLLGSDAGRDRWSRRTDVMLLVEVDVATGRVALIGIPRNLTNAPLPPGAARDAVACGCHPGLLNEMYVEASVLHPSLWPGATPEVRGIGAVRAVVSEITGRPIDAVLIADLAGVIRVVDAMGGIDITVPAPVEDAMYPDPIRGDVHLRIAAGRQHMDGPTGLAYARSRHQDSDYGRMERQQTLLLAVRDAIGPGTILAAPALLGAARGMAWTDLPRESLPALIELFGRAAHAPVFQLRLVPSAYPAALTRAEVDRIRVAIAALLPGSATPAPAIAPFPVAAPVATPVPTGTRRPGTTPAPTPTASTPPADAIPVGDYRCLDIGAASHVIAADGLDLVAITPQPPDAAFDADWIVVGQDPAPGNPVAPGSPVGVIVAAPGTACR